MTPDNKFGGSFGPNEWLVDEMYEQFLKDPNSVDENWKAFFAAQNGSLPSPNGSAPKVSTPPIPKRDQVPQPTPAPQAPAPTQAKAPASNRPTPSKDSYGYRSFFKEPAASTTPPATKGGNVYQGWQDWATRGQQFANKTKQKVTASKTNDPRSQEADYGDDFQALVRRVRQLAGEGPRKTVYDPEKRVYKTVPVNPKKDKQ